MKIISMVQWFCEEKPVGQQVGNWKHSRYETVGLLSNNEVISGCSSPGQKIANRKWLYTKSLGELVGPKMMKGVVGEIFERGKGDDLRREELAGAGSKITIIDCRRFVLTMSLSWRWSPIEDVKEIKEGIVFISGNELKHTSLRNPLSQMLGFGVTLLWKNC